MMRMWSGAKLQKNDPNHFVYPVPSLAFALSFFFLPPHPLLPSPQLTIDTNRPPAPLSSLFEDVMRPVMEQNNEVARAATSIMSVVLVAQNVDVTILVSKKGGSYRHGSEKRTRDGRDVQDISTESTRE